MTEALKIAKRINKLSDVNVFENSRSSKVVEVRSLLNKILYDFKNMTLAQIRDFYRNTGKPMDHATVLHSLKNFNMYRRYNPKLNEYFDEMIKQYELSTKYEKINSIEHKIKYLSDDSLDKAHDLVNELFTKDLIG
jgi:hypothetical protein|tara:strand:- start:2348 stop:2755 length:408 start_codon:yes stop_codon:yes gene_type:complete